MIDYGMLKSFFILFILFPFPETSKAQVTRPNIIIIIADDVSWDDFGAYGNSEVKTPNIDKLAANGLRFTNFYLTASSCSPSRNSIITGRYPHNTGAAELHTEPPEEMLSLAELLKKEGYYTASSGKFHMGQYARRGFDHISEKREEIGDGGEEMWIPVMENRPKGKPFFLWFAALDAHRPWGPNTFEGTHSIDETNPPFYLAKGIETKKDLVKYYDEITRFDHYIGEVVQKLKEQNVLDNTLVIIMSDNGRPFPHSKTRVNDRGMKTPFIVHWPVKIGTSAVSESQVSVIDIAPTLLSLVGVETPEQFQGKSFESLFENPSQEFRNYVFAEHNWHDYEAHERMVRNKNFMYILNSRTMAPQMGPADAVESPAFIELDQLRKDGKLTAAQADVFITPRPQEELYHYRNDPLQLLNIAAVPEFKSDLEDLKSVLKEWMTETGDNIPDKLTKDWYMREPGYVKSEFFEIRGEMPGKSTDAVKNNSKGPF